MNYSFEYLSNLVDEWAEARGIFNGSTPQAQLLKAASEFGELCDAEIKGILPDQKDALGDVLVCLIIYCGMKNYNLTRCLQEAYEEIKDRKGHMVRGGAFVKD